MHIRANPIKLSFDTGVSQVVWELSESVPYIDDLRGVESTTKHVVTSASTIPDIPETYVFACDAGGTWLSGSEQAGSFRGSLDHAEAIARFLASKVVVAD